MKNKPQKKVFGLDALFSFLFLSLSITIPPFSVIPSFLQKALPLQLQTIDGRDVGYTPAL